MMKSTLIVTALATWCGLVFYLLAQAVGLPAKWIGIGSGFLAWWGFALCYVGAEYGTRAGTLTWNGKN